MNVNMDTEKSIVDITEKILISNLKQKKYKVILYR